MSAKTRKLVAYDHQTFTMQAYGGISRYFCELAARINATPGFSSTVIAPLHFNQHLAQARVPHVGFHIGFEDPRWQRLCRGANRLLSPAITWARSPALVHRTFFSPLGRHRDVPLVLTVFDMIHEIYANEFGATDAVSRNKRLSVEQADHILCISESTAHDLSRLFGTPRSKISITHLGYSPVFDAKATDQKQQMRRPYVLYVGHRSGYKNFESVLRAFAASPRLLADFDLMLFGGPALDPAEKTLIAGLGVPEQRVVHRGGSDSELAAAYRNAHVFAYPSIYEGFGIPPLEAMASGCPVVCSNTSSIPEVVGNAARLFDPADVGDIRQALEDVCFDDAFRTTLQTTGRQRADLFSWDRCAADTASAYRGLLGELQAQFHNATDAKPAK